MAVKARKRSAAENAALQRFVELVRPIAAVQLVALAVIGPAEVTTYVKECSQDVYEAVSRAEDQVIEGFPGVVIEFHVYALDSLSAEHQTLIRPTVIFDRENDG